MYLGIYTYILSNVVFFGAIPHQFKRLVLIIWETILDCKTVGFFLKISKEIGKAWGKSLTHAKRGSLTRL